jgi:hypothetical protein
VHGARCVFRHCSKRRLLAHLPEQLRPRPDDMRDRRCRVLSGVTPA